MVDERFAALVLDYFAAHNVIVAEGAGARAVLELLAAPQDIKGKTTLFYADTADPALGYARKLKCCTCNDLHVLPSTLVLLIKLKDFLAEKARPLLLYAAGSTWFIQMIVELATTTDLNAGKIYVERVDLNTLRITCGACRTNADYDTSSPVACKACGRGLVATSFYSEESNSFWGAVVKE
jgi:hypothetical protein